MLIDRRFICVIYHSAVLGAVLEILHKVSIILFCVLSIVYDLLFYSINW